jgi:hypothetical protein
MVAALMDLKVDLLDYCGQMEEVLDFKGGEMKNLRR